MSALETLDTRGLLCPLPVIRTQDKINTLLTGAQLIVLADDPGAMHDIPAWCRIHGHRLLDAEQTGRDIRIRIEVCATS